jgi:hypothetical protein
MLISETEKLKPFLTASGFQLIKANIGSNAVDPGCEFSLRSIGFGCLPNPYKDFLSQVFRLRPVSNETINKIQNGSLMTIYQDFQGISITFCDPGHQTFA